MLRLIFMPRRAKKGLRWILIEAAMHSAARLPDLVPEDAADERADMAAALAICEQLGVDVSEARREFAPEQAGAAA